jgi:hypothetical protein
MLPTTLVLTPPEVVFTGPWTHTIADDDTAEAVRRAAGLNRGIAASVVRTALNGDRYVAILFGNGYFGTYKLAEGGTCS